MIKKREYSTSAWSGGTTTELFIAPEGKTYGERNFLWRLSSATVDLEESTFTALPDYDRIIMTLEGEMDLSHNGGDWIHLKEFMPHAFDGGDVTVSRGRVVDFNLMLRKGMCEGEMVPVLLKEGEEAVLGAGDGESLLFCHRGRLAVENGGGAETLEAGETLRIDEAPAGGELTCRAMTDVRAVFVKVRIV